MCKVTVLMPVYNGERYLNDAMDSILNQSFSDFEFLIINDGSTDRSVEIIHSYADPRIRLISQANGGVAKALNTGLKEAKGKYIARFDADDISYPDRLQVQYDFMIDNPDYIAIAADMNFINEEGDFIFLQVAVSHTYEEIQKTIKQHCPFLHSSVFMLKSYALELGGYPERAHDFEDHMLWIKFVEAGKICNLRQILGDYRINANSVTIDDRDMGVTFSEIKKKALETGEITEEEEKTLLTCKRKFTKKEKEISYNRMVGKKYLWNNYEPKKARKHLKKAIKAKPFNFMSWFLMVLSFFPESTIKRIYRFVKR